MDRKSRAERWGVATDEEIASAAQSPNLVWLDVRTANEVAEHALAEGLNVRVCNVTMFNAKELEAAAPTLLPDKGAPMLIFCAAGGRAEVAIKCLKKMGYTGTMTNGGSLEDVESAVGTTELQRLAAAGQKKTKKKGTCIIS